MQLAQLINKMRKEGYHATRGRIRCALSSGFVQPKPKKAARGAYNWTPRHLGQLRWYFIHVRPGPQPDHLIPHFPFDSGRFGMTFAPSP